jgi:hypothetical protein
MISNSSEELTMILAIFSGFKKSEAVRQQTDNAKVGTDRFSLKKLNYVKDKEQCQVKISNMFAALETWMIIWTSTKVEKE